MLISTVTQNKFVNIKINILKNNASELSVIDQSAVSLVFSPYMEIKRKKQNKTIK